MERRAALKVLCASTGAMCGGFAGCSSPPPEWMPEKVSYVALPALSQGQVTLNLGDFPQLKKDGGGVLGQAAGMETPLAVVRMDASTFVALPAVCTHMACPLKLNSLNASLDCTCHGSTFELDGTVINGPATKALTSFKTEFDGNGTLRITITG